MNQMMRDLTPVVKTNAFKRALGTNYESFLNCFTKSKNGWKGSFEEILGAYEKMYQDDSLHKWLCQYIPKKHDATGIPAFPTFAHECCAHLTCTKKLKYFISLNFDEVLEATLHDELGERAVQVAASLDEFQRLRSLPIDEWGVEFGLPEPKCFVLKPHGTISRARTLKHLPELVDSFPVDIGSVLTGVMKDAVVVFLGFGNYNHDFRLLFAETYARGITDDVVIVDLNPQSVLEGIAENGLRTPYSYQGSADDFFEALEARLQKDGSFRTSHQSSCRHRIRTSFFQLFSRQMRTDVNKKRYQEDTQVLKNIPQWWYSLRLYELELLIYLIKTKGLFVSLAVLGCDRINGVLVHCLTHLQKGEIPSRVNTNIDPAARLAAILKALFHFVPASGKHGSNSLNAYWCILLKDHTSQTIFENIAELFTARILSTIQDELKQDSVWQWLSHRLDTNNRKFISTFATQAGQLFKDFDVDLSCSDYSGMVRFRNAVLLGSRPEFLSWTASVFSRSWNHLRIASAAGGWIGKELKKVQNGEFRNKRVEIDLIVNLDMLSSLGDISATNRRSANEFRHYDTVIDGFIELIAGVKTFQHATLRVWGIPAWEHHLVVSSTVQRANSEKFLAGTYFRRRGKNTSIAPVRLEGPEDLSDLSAYFDRRKKRGSAVPLFSVEAQEGNVAFKMMPRRNNRVIDSDSARQMLCLALEQSMPRA